MSGLNPSAPSQPSMQSGLNQSHNPASKTDREETKAQDTQSQGEIIDRREKHDVPSTHGDDATATSLGRGDTGPLKERNVSESDKSHSYSQDGNLEGEQMRAPGEGEVADAVRSGGGGGHGEMPSMTKNLDARAADHAEQLHERGQRTGAEIEEEEQEDWTGKKADVAEALGGRDTAIVLAPEE